MDDKATALLMTRFYQNLLGQRLGLGQPLPKADALDEAKRWLRDLTAAEAGTELAALGLPVADGQKTTLSRPGVSKTSGCVTKGLRPGSSGQDDK